jgi:hypothetical protein
MSEFLGGIRGRGKKWKHCAGSKESGIEIYAGTERTEIRIYYTPKRVCVYARKEPTGQIIILFEGTEEELIQKII